ncbi:MAG: glycerophosphodiester phosphodiesterase [Candidatus Dormiibacterota bacterium]
MAVIGAHRGATATAAENTLPAFEAAIRLGTDFIEFDVRRTSDLALIVLHDRTVGGEPVASLTRDAIYQKSGVRPPLLLEVLELAAGRIGLDVELKEDGYVAEVVDQVRRRSPPERVVYTSFLDAVIQELRVHEPSAKTGLILGRSSPSPYLGTRLSEIFPVPRLRRAEATFAFLHFQLTKLGALRRAHAAGIPTLVWTVNGNTRLRHFLSNPAVYGVITDQPEQALAIRDGLRKSAARVTSAVR